MGSGNSAVKVLKEQDSIVALGQKCVASEAIGKEVDFDIFWEELINFLKVPTAGEMCKEIEVVDVSDKEFRIVRTMDKDKLSEAMGLDVPLAEDPKSYMIYRPIRDIPDLPDLRLLVEEERDSIMELKTRGVTCVLRGPPMRIEHFRQLVMEDRRSGVMVAAFMKAVLQGVLGTPADEIEILQEQDTRICPMPIGLLSAMSLPLDDQIDFDGLWDGIMNVILSPDAHADEKKVSQDDGKVMIVESIKKVDLAETELAKAAAEKAVIGGATSDDEIKAAANKAVEDYRQAVDNGEISGLSLDIRTSVLVRYEKECQIPDVPYLCGVYTLEACDHTGTLAHVFHIIIHKDPLQMEVFMHLPTPRMVGDRVEGLVQIVMDKVIERIKERPSA